MAELLCALLEQPSEQNTYSDIEAAYRCLVEKYGTKEEDIILYGQSVGSGPTLDLATRLPNLRAVILHSPIMSGLRVMYPVKRTYWFDIYKVDFYFYFYAELYNLNVELFTIFQNLTSQMFFCLFAVQNIDKIPLVKCPVLVIHVSIFQFLYFSKMFVKLKWHASLV